jgi:predicted Zn-ribbon and HTH transcriptional regulator
MLKAEILADYESQTLFTKMRNRFQSSLQPIFILCDRCYWCATYFDKTRIPNENNCPQCSANNNELTSFPIMANELFIYF